MITARHAGQTAIGWRAAKVDNALTLATHDIYSGRTKFVILTQIRDSDRGPSEEATIAAVRGSEVLVLGSTWFAAQIRQRLTEPGVTPALGLAPLPGPGTPLNQLVFPLSKATRLLLERVGFSSVEELAIVSRGCWNSLPRFGPKRAEELSHALRQQSQSRPHRGFADRRALIAAGLAPVDLARHKIMIDLLASSDLPVTAAREVCQRLTFEGIPSLDPQVTALLGDAADPALLSYYRSTHHA